MPVGEGWWLHATGKSYEVYEHMGAIVDEPLKFGFKPNEIAPQAGETQPAHRDRVLRTAMKHSWIRVRRSGWATVFEYDKLTRRIADAIFMFLVDVLGAGPVTNFEMHEVSTRRGFSVQLKDFYEEVEAHLSGADRARGGCRGGCRLYLIGRACGHGLP